MLFTLSIVFVVFWQGTVGFLTTDFCLGKLICQDNDITYIHEEDVPKTFHTFDLRDEFETCLIYCAGTGFVYPSQWDTVSRELK